MTSRAQHTPDIPETIPPCHSRTHFLGLQYVVHNIHFTSLIFARQEPKL